MNRLTEANIRDLFLGFSKDYKEYEELQYSHESIGSQLNKNLNFSLQNPKSKLSQLYPEEKVKTRQLLQIFLHAKSGKPYQHSPKQPRPHLKQFVVVHEPLPQCYCHRDTLLYDYLLFNALFPSRPVYRVYQPLWGLWPFYHRHHHRNNHHGRRKKEDKEENNGSILAGLVVVAIAGIGFILTGLALYYLVQHMANNIERLSYNEGIMRSLTHMAMTLASGAAGSILTAVFLSAPLISLGIAAGMGSPIILAVLGVIVMGMVTSSAGCFVTNKIQAWQIQSSNADKIDPLEPQRFSISEKEEVLLRENGYNLLVARAALVALRCKIAAIENESSGSDKKPIGTQPMPFFLNRLFGTQHKQDIHSILKQIRQLKKGKLASVDVDGMHFDLCSFPVEYAPPQNYAPSAPPLYENDFQPGQVSEEVIYPKI